MCCVEWCTGLFTHPANHQPPKQTMKLATDQLPNQLFNQPTIGHHSTASISYHEFIQGKGGNKAWRSAAFWDPC